MLEFKEWREGGGEDILLYTVALPRPGGLKSFAEWRTGGDAVVESVTHTRYSVEINYQSKQDEVLEKYAQIALGYVSAALKQYQYHVKHVYTDKPLRILVGSRNWDDGEWVAVVSWNPTHKCFVVSKGYYNKDRRSVSIQGSERCGDSPADITKHVYNLMHHLKSVPDKWKPRLKGAQQKRGPKG